MPVLVCLSGLPGVGKSTIARALAEQTGALHLRIDMMEAAMRQSHMNCDDLADGGYAAAQAVAGAALDQGFDVIADSVNPIALTRRDWRKPSKHHRHLDVMITYSDPAEHRRRVDTRENDIEGHTLPTWEAVQNRRFEPFPDADIHLDASQLSREEAILRLFEAMQAAKHEDTHV